MSLKNIQRSKQKVLNRPMFAKMKDGTIKPVQYHWIGAAINVGTKVVPWAYRGIKSGGKYAMPYIKQGLGGIKNYMRPGGGYGKGINAETAKRFPELAKKVKRAQMFNITSMHPANIALQGVPFGAPFAYNYLKGDKKNEEESLDSVMAPSPDPGHFEDEFGSMHTKTKFEEKKGKKKEKITDTITEDIKSGNMDEMIKDKITLFEKYLGTNKKEKMKGAAY